MGWVATPGAGLQRPGLGCDTEAELQRQELGGDTKSWVAIPSAGLRYQELGCDTRGWVATPGVAMRDGKRCADTAVHAGSRGRGRPERIQGRYAGTDIPGKVPRATGLLQSNIHLQILTSVSMVAGQNGLRVDRHATIFDRGRIWNKSSAPPPPACTHC